MKRSTALATGPARDVADERGAPLDDTKVALLFVYLPMLIGTALLAAMTAAHARG